MRLHDSKISEWKTLSLSNEYTYRSQLRSNWYIKPKALHPYPTPSSHTHTQTHTHYTRIQSDTKKKCSSARAG